MVFEGGAAMLYRPVSVFFEKIEATMAVNRVGQRKEEQSLGFPPVLK
jgi:hypothetical protein